MHDLSSCVLLVLVAASAGSRGGRMTSTALAVLSLESRYRYARPAR